jgi:hypothetical protein
MLNLRVMLPAALTWYDVIRVYVHELVPVGPGLLVEDTQCMKQFVDGAALPSETVGAILVRWLQRHDLRASKSAHIRPAPASNIVRVGSFSISISDFVTSYWTAQSGA